MARKKGVVRQSWTHHYKPLARLHDQTPICNFQILQANPSTEKPKKTKKASFHRGHGKKKGRKAKKVKKEAAPEGSESEVPPMPELPEPFIFSDDEEAAEKYPVDEASFWGSKHVTNTASK